MTRILLTAALCLVAAVPSAQIPQGAFTEALPPEEFAAHRAAVIAEIGDAVAIIQGAVERPAELPFRQSAQFYYLTGVEVPRAILLMDGRAKTSTLYIDPAGFKVRAFGPSLTAGPEAAKITGLDAVVPREAFAAAVQAIGRDRSPLLRRGGLRRHRRRIARRGERARGRDQARSLGRPRHALRGLRRAAARGHRARRTSSSRISIRSSTAPATVKSPREIAVIREATRIAGLGIMEAMREAEPGMFEYELQAVAEYVFKKHGAQGPAYFALVATGPNTVYSHYHKGTRKLAAGDLVQFDYAPDYQYYVSDVTRVFPANGKFTPLQRELYGDLPRDVSRADVGDPPRRAGPRSAPGRRQEDGRRDSGDDVSEREHQGRGAAIRRSLQEQPGIELRPQHRPRSARRRPRPSGRRRAGDAGSGTAVHDRARAAGAGGGLAMRLEDALLVTPTGYENLSAFVPLEIAAIEKLMTEPGI